MFWVAQVLKMCKSPRGMYLKKREGKNYEKNCK
jgi:hypothetical protein